MDLEKQYKIALHHFGKFGPAKMKNLMSYFSTSKAAYDAPVQKLIEAGIGSDTAAEFLGWRAKTDINAILSAMDQEGIQAVSLDEPEYPKLLKEIYNPPFILYYRGSLECLKNFPLAVVGARKFTYYGQQAVDKIVSRLAQNRLCIVSGLALGIDALAHNACLKAGGATVGVLGSGLDKKSLYPAANRDLAERIVASGGAVISEFPLRTEPLRFNFPQRNRTISGLSLGTLVIEAGERSGALITAEYALEQNREIFAVPGNIFSLVSAGPNNLIKKGAIPVTEAEDLMKQLQLEDTAKIIDNRRNLASTSDEQKIIDILSHEAIHINEIIRLSAMKSQSVIAAITILEMKGQAKNVGNMEYVKMA